MTYFDYLDKLKDNNKIAIKIAWLNYDDTVAFEFTDELYDLSGTLNVNRQNGTRRTCTISLNNSRNRFPIDYNNIWFGQKFKLWMGVYLNDTTPFYIPQGVFYVKDPSDIYSPTEKKITIEGVDKWAMLDGTLGGYIDGIYQTPINTNLFDAIRNLLLTSKLTGDILARDSINIYDALDPVIPLLDNYYLKTDGTIKDIAKCPYTAIQERGKTYADILLEYADILGAAIYYDANGRLVVKPLHENIYDDDKEILWEFTVNEREFMGLDQKSNFTKVYNDVIVLGNIISGKQAKARVQNTNPMSNTCVGKIGLKTRPPYEDTQYVTDEQCKALAEEYLKQETILQKSGTITSSPLFHLDVDKLCTVSTPNNQMKKDKYLINGYSLPISNIGTMSIEVTNVVDLQFTEVAE